MPVECELSRTISRDITILDFRQTEAENKENINDKNLPVKKRRDASQRTKEETSELVIAEQGCAEGQQGHQEVYLLSVKNKKDKSDIQCVVIGSDGC